MRIPMLWVALGLSACTGPGEVEKSAPPPAWPMGEASVHDLEAAAARAINARQEPTASDVDTDAATAPTAPDDEPVATPPAPSADDADSAPAAPPSP